MRLVIVAKFILVVIFQTVVLVFLLLVETDKQGTPKESLRIQQPKRFSSNNIKDEDNSPKNLNLN